MKVVNGDKIVLYLNNKYMKYKKMKNIDDFEGYFKSIFEILKDKYNIKLYGFYNIDVYRDNNYGVVIEIENEEFDFDYYCNQIDMNIVLHNANFLYKIDDLENSLNNKIYFYKSNYYVDEVRNIEFGELVYKTDDIINNAKIIEI